MTGGGALRASSGRFEGIDALRGLAALLVVWMHTSELFVRLPGIAAHGTGLDDLAVVLNVGRVGVIAFFAISGFVIVPTLTGTRVSGTRDFAIKRLLRLFPPFWVSMALASYALWYLFDKPLHWTTIVANATMFPVEWGAPQIMGHYWTLEVELIFYALVVVLFWCGMLHRPKALAGTVLFLSVASLVLDRNRHTNFIVQRNFVWEFLSYFLSVMFWGALVRARQDSGIALRAWHVELRRDWPLYLVTLVVFVRPLLAALYGNAHVEDWRAALLGLLLFLAFTRIVLRPSNALVWLGTISYSLYLFHPIVFYPMFHRVEADESFAHGPLWVYVVASMAGSVLLAAMTYRIVELPANRYARRLVALRHGAPPGGVASPAS